MSLPIKQLLLGGSDDMVVSLQPQEEQEGEPGNKITISNINLTILHHQK